MRKILATEPVPLKTSGTTYISSIILGIHAFYSDRRGATAIEYSLIAALVAIVMIGGLGALGSNISAKFASIAANLT
jgi:pilus assembly protein Flp/PilA